MEQLRKSTQKQGWQWILWSGILASISIGGILLYSFWLNRPSAALTVRALEVQQGSVEDKIEESGVVELANQQVLKAPNETTVERVLVQPGAQVRVGQELILLRNPTQQTALARTELELEKQQLIIERDRQKVSDAENKLNVARARLQELNEQRHSTQLEIRKKELEMTNARAELRDSQEKLQASLRQLESDRELEERGFIAGSVLRNQEETVRSDRASVRQVEFQINNALVDLQDLQLKLSLTRQELQDNVRTAEAELRQAQLDLDTAQRDLQRQELEYQENQQVLQNNIITSPINGIILDLKVNPGDGVQTGNELLTLGDPSEERVKLQLSILNATRVKPNQEARISVIGPNPQQFSGRVISLSLQALSSEASAGGRGGSQISVPAIVKLDRPTGTLIPGSQVSVEVILDQRQDILTIPVEAVQRDGSATSVWIADGENLAQKRDVTLGLEGLSEVEIVSGLQEGDRAILPSPGQTLTPGTPVNAETISPSGGSRSGRSRRRR
ncbi:efflux RND transporter periplasmic adaptor subunit [Oscillatoria amoena NRMC-F 0135]|nr:efflux RND transporter periplasmic adaptor subunit [Geitlerinema splendidum]MDL5047079.1 efflux RND transporter periplasmic adaptor subunit [Oscillatoria amoena NRMC-F 0135]